LSSKFAEWLLVASAMWILLLVLRVRAVARLERRDSTPGSGLVVGKCSFWRIETSARYSSREIGSFAHYLGVSIA
jgi:hypothetical protein